jgi:3-methyladenine DNA glycosylase AlkC
MAEPLKNSFGPEVPTYLADLLGSVVPRFPRKRFIAASVDGLDDLELMQRSRHIADVLAATLPADRGDALQILIDALRREGLPQELHGMVGFRYLPLVDFVAVHGLDNFELAMTLQYELTQRFTAEFCIRPYIEVHRDATLDRLREWTADPSEHVRRLVSEGTRPRLPWAPRLREFMADPAPVVELLELLKDDPSEYVRRSVANNINDIAKDHPDVAVAIARRWWRRASPERKRLVKHGLRTLIKQGDSDALAVIGFGADTPLQISRSACIPTAVAIGESTRVEVDLHNPTGEIRVALVDIVVHFVKANGSTSPKVFKGAEIEVAPGATTTVRKSVSLRVHSTRTPYVGEHRVDVLINGATVPVGSFDVTG